MLIHLFRIRCYLIVYLGCICLSTYGQALPAKLPNIPQEIEEAFRLGNSNLLLPWMAARVSLTMEGKQAYYSKKDARWHLRTFFRQHPPEAFQHIHHGASKGGFIYYIAQYKTTEMNYGVYLLVKQSGSNYRLHAIDLSPQENEE